MPEISKMIEVYENAISAIENEFKTVIETGVFAGFIDLTGHYMDDCGQYSRFLEYKTTYQGLNVPYECLSFLRDKVEQFQIIKEEQTQQACEDKKYGTEQEQANSDYYASR